MMKLSRGAWIAIAAVAAVPATVAIAKTVDGGGWHRMSPETRARLDEGKLAMAKTALKLSADQEKLWTPVEDQVRSFFKDREAKMAERQKMREARKNERADDKKAERKRPDIGERVEKMSQNMTERAERMKAFAGAFKPFYASLSDEQKEVLRPLVRDLGPGFGGRGHKGPRWAFGGGWGSHGKGHHGWGGPRGERGGPMMDDGSPAEAPQQGSDDTKPADAQ